MPPNEKNCTNMINSATPRSVYSITKRVCFLRHGQALHNPRAEEAKAKGCSHSSFLQLMREDDAFDAHLTPLGLSQGRRASELHQHNIQDVELVVSSPLSRAIQTADLAACPNSGNFDNRVCVEHFREINGWLLNAKRRSRTDLENRFHSSWDFSGLSEDDEEWTETLESEESCAERGYQGLLWLRDRPEDSILTVAHGGLLRFIANHDNVKVIDHRPAETKRFGNCELREYHVEWNTESEEENVTKERPLVILTEIHSGK